MRDPKISIIVVAYNMARELPRTLQSLSTSMQRGLSESDYEVIVVDNGSTRPFDQNLCQSLLPNSTYHYENNSGVSPVAAINKGIARARGEVIGVMIDGARMASPGLLKNALDAAQLRPNAVIGTLAYHLGETVQMAAVKTGYCQAVEDTLLGSIDWQNDGYRLFDISVPAGSSAGGWFVLPSESNAFFMAKESWKRLGGFDEKFQMRGGGFANIDTWERACTLKNIEVIMLLGEATFHQFHGGVATNSPTSSWAEFHDEYIEIRGHPYKAPHVENIRYFGSIRTNQRKSVLESALALQSQVSPPES